MGKQRLGTNLNALLGGAKISSSVSEDLFSAMPVENEKQVKDGELKKLPVEFIQRGKYQPRKDMHPDALEELAQSIREQGLLQPIVVRPLNNKNSYEIIAGERRWRASQLAGLSEIPAVIRYVPDETAIAMALVENIQREDLNPLEEAIALSRLQKEFELTQEETAKAVGKSRAAVANSLRLLLLSEETKKLLEHGDLEMGHARALISLTALEQHDIAKTVITKGLSVRQTEDLVRSVVNQKKQGKKSEKKRASPDVLRLEKDLSERLGAGVVIQCNAKGKGKLVISYNSLDELDGVLEHIK